MSSLVSLFIRMLILSDHSPILMTSYNFKYLEVPFPNTVTLRVRASTYEGGGYEYSIHYNGRPQ